MSKVVSRNPKLPHTVVISLWYPIELDKLMKLHNWGFDMFSLLLQKQKNNKI